VSFTLFVLPVVLPVLFWAGYHYVKDRCLPEPVHHLLVTFILGVGSWYLGLAMYQGLGMVGLRQDAYLLAEVSLPALFAYSVLVIGFFEETAKLIPFLLIIIHFDEFDEPLDGIIYASFIALGFAAVENIRYLPYLSGWEALARGFAGPVVHMVFASVWGYYIGRAWLCQRAVGWTIVGALAFSAFMHGLYDAVVIAMPPWALPAAAFLIIVLWFWRLAKIRDLHALPPGPCPED